MFRFKFLVTGCYDIVYGDFMTITDVYL